MATVYIDEYSGLGDMNPNNAPFRRMNGEIAQTPAIANQTVSITAGSVQSNAFNSLTYLVRVHTDSVMSFAFGANPTASATTARMAANQTEYFAVIPGQKIAVITNT